MCACDRGIHVCLCVWRLEFNNMPFSVSFHFYCMAGACTCMNMCVKLYVCVHISAQVKRRSSDIFLYKSLPYSFRDLSLNLELFVFLS